MTSCNFQTTCYGKWILCGEHAVLRDSSAIVFPRKDKRLELRYYPSKEKLKADYKGTHGEDVHITFWSVLEYGLEKLGYSLSDVKGRFEIDNTIPLGAGMGASAALCAALGKWFVAHQFIAESDHFEFSRTLENLFHSQSSGVDIVGVVAKQGVLFNRHHAPITIKQKWQPLWFLSYCDEVGVTSHCVKKVKELIEQHPKRAAIIDKQMSESVERAFHALQSHPQEGLPELTQAIRQANQCFSDWGLNEGNIQKHIQQLLQAGALAAKPTGSGSGGYVLSLWGDTRQFEQLKKISLESI